MIRSLLIGALLTSPWLHATDPTPEQAACIRADHGPEGRILARYPVQDQDGLGTCYANAGALLIQHHLGLSATPSYHHMALAQAFHENRPGASLVNRAVGGPMTLASEGGRICSAVAGAREVGFCRATSFGLDTIRFREDLDPQGGDPIGIQAYIMLELGRFFEENETRALLQGRTRDGWQQVQRRLAQGFANRAAECHGGENADVRKGRYVARRFLRRLAQELDCDEAESRLGGTAEERQRLLAQVFPQGIQAPPASDALQEAASFLAPYIRQAEGYRRHQYNDATHTEDVIHGMVTEPALFELFARRRGFSLPPRIADPLHLMGNRELPGDLAAWNVCHRSHTGIDRELLEDALSPLCHLNWGTAPIRDEDSRFASSIVAALSSLGSENFRQRVTAFMTTLSPLCASEAQRNRASAANLSCTDAPVTSVASASWRVRRALCEGRMVGVGICTDFMVGSNPNTQFCQNRSRGVPGHGMHAITVIGHRGAENAREYLVQNSWGRHCPENIPGIRCERDGHGPTGRWWVQEALLFNNSVSTAIMEGAPTVR